MSVNTLKSLIERKEFELLLLNLLLEIDKDARLSFLVKTFQSTPHIPDSLFKKLGEKLSCNPRFLKQIYLLTRNNGDYIASFFDEEDGVC
jgi:hypothetical protein